MSKRCFEHTFFSKVLSLNALWIDRKCLDAYLIVRTTGSLSNNGYNNWHWLSVLIEEVKRIDYLIALSTNLEPMPAVVVNVIPAGKWRNAILKKEKKRPGNQSSLFSLHFSSNAPFVSSSPPRLVLRMDNNFWLGRSHHYAKHTHTAPIMRVFLKQLAMI